MKILHVTNNYPTETSPIYGIFVKEQIESIQELGIECDVFFINGREKGKIEYIRSSFRLRKLLQKEQYDVIHCHHSFSFLSLLFSGVSSLFPTITSFQSDPYDECGKFLFKLIYKYSNIIIIKNNSTKVKGDKIIYQPNGVNLNFFTPLDKNNSKIKLGLDLNKNYILFVDSNTLRNTKRYDRFCEVMRILKEDYKLDNISELTMINVKRHLVPTYFNACDLHLLTSDFEGSPNSVKEALACNISVVSTNVGNVLELQSLLGNIDISYNNNPNKIAYLVYKRLNAKQCTDSRNLFTKHRLDIKSVAENIIAIYNKIQQIKY